MKDILKYLLCIIIGSIITLTVIHFQNETNNNSQTNLYSFSQELDTKSKEINSFYKQHIDKGLSELKYIPFNNDFCKKFIIKTDKEHNLYPETFKKLYYDYIERKYKSLYSTPYKYLIVYKSPYTDDFHISFYYDEKTIDK